MNVVQMPAKSRGGAAPQASLAAIAEEPLQPRSQPKRKQTGKSRSTVSKSKAAKTYPAPRSAQSQLFADELQHLEELAERINHVLAERSRQTAYFEEPSLPTHPHRRIAESDPRYGSPYPRSPLPPQLASQPGVYGQPTLEEEDSESLKQQARRIRQRLSQLEALIEEAEAAEAPVDFSDIYHNHSYHSPISPAPPRPTWQNAVASPPPTPHPQPAHAPRSPVDPSRQRAEFESWRAAEELRRLQHQDQWTYPETDNRDRAPHAHGLEPVLRQVAARFKRFPTGTFLAVPRRPMDWLNDAAMWIVLAAIARIASRYLVMAVPFLSPILTLMLLSPAALAIFLALFMPKTGWVSFYRLFLIMVGLLVGGKLF